MANENKPATPNADAELDDLAFKIFSQAVATAPGRRGGEREALESYRLAEAFLAVRRKVKSGEAKPKPKDGPELASCSAPNLPRYHPHNLVARQVTLRVKGAPTGTYQGDLAKVQKINEWLDRNPTPEQSPEELVPRLANAFPELAWDLETINLARAIFPAYCRN